jgi:tetratricopeptide (TPR) repeat protein
LTLNVRLAFSIAIACTGVAFAQNPPPDYLGARKVLSEMTALPGGSALGDPRVVFARAVTNFGDRNEAMSPEKAATGWLAIVRKAFAASDQQATDYNSYQIQGLLKVLPSPASWPVIEKRLTPGRAGEQNRDLILRLLLQVLQAKYPAAWSTIHTLESKIPRTKGFNGIDQVEIEIAARTRNFGAMEAAFKHEVIADPTSLCMTFSQGPSIYVPDLVTLFGRDRASQTLRDLLLRAKAELTFGYGSGTATAELARSLSKKLVEQVTWPQWTLADSLDAGDMFPVFRRRFPKNKLGVGADSNSPLTSYDGAAQKYLINTLFASGPAKAEEIFKAYPHCLDTSWGFTQEDLSGPLRQRGKLGAFLKFLDDLSQRHPESGAPSLYIQLAGTDDPARTRSFLNHIPVNPAQPYSQEWVRGQLQTLDLREGRYEAAVANLTRPSATPGFPLNWKLFFALGRLLKRPDLIEHGMDLASQTLFEYPFDDDVLPILLAHGRGPGIEKSLIESMHQGYLANGSAEQAAEELAKFYFGVGRYRDVVTLLEKFPGWEATDLSNLSSSDLQFKSAKSLATIGRKPEALRIIRHLLKTSPGEDEAYELLLQLDPRDIAGTLPALIRQYPSVSRPLIWSAECLRRQRKFREAETLVRRALAIDPNDAGAFRQATRFKADIELAQIQQALGDATGKDRAIRYVLAAHLAKEAGEAQSLDLLQVAKSKYQAELAVLPNDFASRNDLAKIEESLGHFKDAEAQLMLASRNVAASSGSDDFNINPLWAAASAVRYPRVKALLESQVAKGTENPGVYNLLGGMEQTTGNQLQASKDYLVAWHLAPTSIPALRGLDSVQAFLSSAVSRKVAAELTVLGATGDWYEVQIPNYAECWVTSAKARERSLPIIDPAFPLRESEDTLSSKADPNFVNNYENVDRGRIMPADRFERERLLSSIWSLLESTRD